MLELFICFIAGAGVMLVACSLYLMYKFKDFMG